MVLTLYKLDLSPPVRSVYMVIEAANIQNVKYVDVNLFEGEHLSEKYRKLNPQHSVPTLQDDDFILWDSHAIAVYLLTKYSNNKTLYPSDPKIRAVIDQRLHFDSGNLCSHLREALRPVLFKGKKSLAPEDFEKLTSGYELANDILTSPWMAGNEFTLADICCVTTISSINELIPIDAKLYPNLHAWFERCKKLDLYKKANEPGLAKFRELIKSKLPS